VPAVSYACEVIDRIITRAGALNKVDEGKSTFFTETEETKSILSYGTNRSLAIIDELGRGASTF
jgi:DNA mismatch repair protein MutS